VEVIVVGVPDAEEVAEVVIGLLVVLVVPLL